MDHLRLEARLPFWHHQSQSRTREHNIVKAIDLMQVVGSYRITYDFNVVVFVEHKVLRFQVTVHYLQRLKVFKHIYYLCRVKPNQSYVQFF